MMKKLLLILVLLFPVSAFAWNLQTFGGGTPATGGGGISCSDANVVLVAHFENSDTITTGTPAGCTDFTDTTWTLSNMSYESAWADDGTYCLEQDSVSAGNATIDIDNTSGLEDEGTLTFVLYAPDFDGGGGGELIRVQYNSSNGVDIQRSGTDEIRARFTGGSGAATATSTDCNIVDNTAYDITVKWKTSGSPYISLDCGGTVQTSATDPGTVTAFDDITVGNTGGWTPDFYIDTIILYDSWQ